MNKRYYEHTLSTTREFIEYLRSKKESNPALQNNSSHSGFHAFSMERKKTIRQIVRMENNKEVSL